MLLIAWILAGFSAFWVKPDRTYLEYIDWRSLGILWGLMVIIQGLKENAVFDRIGEILLGRVRKSWQLAAVLIFLCFFGGMLITNDVALITFVPFAMLILKNCGREDLVLPVIVLQTVAANLGSMLTPIGNPQNLYLYGLTGMQMSDFILLMLPYTAAAALLLVCSIVFLPRKAEPVQLSDEEKELQSGSGRQITVYMILFAVSLLTVLRLIPWYVLVLLVCVVLLVMDRRILGRADYVLLLTFVGFFVFTGNMGQIPAIRDILKQLVQGRELLVAVLASQCISNVPAALLLSGFTENPAALIPGVNLGGLGTLIASMASLISYKAFSNAYRESRGRYVIVFTAVNILFLILLLLLYWILQEGNS